MNPDEGWFRGHPRGIDPAECQDLLASLAAGRAAYCDEHGPVVLPVNSHRQRRRDPPDLTPPEPGHAPAVGASGVPDLRVR